MLGVERVFVFLASRIIGIRGAYFFLDIGLT